MVAVRRRSGGIGVDGGVDGGETGEVVGLARRASNREVIMAQEGLGVGLCASVNALVEQPEKELAAVEQARVGVA